MIGEWALMQGDGISCLSIDWTVLLSSDSIPNPNLEN